MQDCKSMDGDLVVSCTAGHMSFRFCCHCTPVAGIDELHYHLKPPTRLHLYNQSFRQHDTKHTQCNWQSHTGAYIATTGYLYGTNNKHHTSITDHCAAFKITGKNLSLINQESYCTSK